MTRIPYATMIATVMCLIGVAIFCITMYRGASLTIIMFDQVFHFRLFWIEAVQMIFVAIGASMAGLGFMILFVGCLATGSTRYKVYRAWRSRVGGRISCAVVCIHRQLVSQFQFFKFKTHAIKMCTHDLTVSFLFSLTCTPVHAVYGNHLHTEHNLVDHVLLPMHRNICLYDILANVLGKY